MPQPQQHGILAASVTYVTPCGNARSLVHWAWRGIKSESSWRLCQVLHPWATRGTPTPYFFKCSYFSARTCDLWFIHTSTTSTALSLSVPLSDTWIVQGPPPAPKHCNILTLEPLCLPLGFYPGQDCWIIGDSMICFTGDRQLAQQMVWQAVSRQQGVRVPLATSSPTFPYFEKYCRSEGWVSIRHLCDSLAVDPSSSRGGRSTSPFYEKPINTLDPPNKSVIIWLMFDNLLLNPGVNCLLFFFFKMWSFPIGHLSNYSNDTTLSWTQVFNFVRVVHFFLFARFLYVLNESIIDLQCGASFFHVAKWLSLCHSHSNMAS